MNSSNYQPDILIIGSGAAGLTCALQLAEHFKVTVICKGELNQGSTYYAQGGIAAVIDDADSIDQHVSDTLTAGAGICSKQAVEFTVRNSREAIEQLVQRNVSFTRRDDKKREGIADYHLTQEGGHSHRRIIHSADATGREVSVTLTEDALRHPNITLQTNRVAVDLIVDDNTIPKRCTGAYVLNRSTSSVELYQSKFTILATGGASKVYLYTSNPDGASGDGIAMAWRAGCRVGNMEFNQFHPTCLYHPQAKSFLITEALRGEGAVLKLANGERFMSRYHPKAELAPRDVVARAIDHEMKRLGEDCVYLDISHKSREFLQQHFPTIMERCLELGIDISQQPIPVVPAAHYTCGGVMVNNSGQTDIPSLYAIGETTFTGLHGANRLASNSLLECLVYGGSTAGDIIANFDSTPAPTNAPAWDESQVTNSDEDVVISHNWDELRRFMWDYVGIVRTDKRLKRALNRAELLQYEIDEYYSNYKVSNDLLELRNLAQVAQLIIRSAMLRKESRGLHYTLDYPETLAHSQDTILRPNN
ncbi:L-aspartate oxidase [Sinobacterium norvegicum]|uniref:L-aspartate oxidase n=1 Tax=Sinobacterium norvegicum TaxID=1641715 RepID=A0ABM9AB47_9GAMM|nr:L-aspartate oxidase [Sinobacterium norvegicum]CAH0990423.1 L-aspartate oxidase [Sinobacterium norvegicum]